MGLYETDYAAWADQTAQRLRSGDLKAIDMGALIEEVEELSGSVRKGIRSQLSRLLFHLLKLSFAGANDVARAANGWRGTVANARQEIMDDIEHSPSLAAYPLEHLERSYSRARELALIELELESSEIPTACPWLIEQVMSSGFFGDRDISI